MSTNIRQIVPEVAWINVNRDCNFRCKWCYAQDTSYSLAEEMELNLAKDLALILKEMEVKKIILIGGEPTLWEPIIEFNHFCNEINMRTSLVTNAMKFGVDKFWAAYKKHPNTDTPWISAKAYDRNSLQKTCGVFNFDTVTLGLKRATEFFNCGLSFVYNSYFTDDLIEMTKYAIELGAKSVRICPCTPAFVKNTAVDQYMIETELYISNIVRDYQKLSEITNDNLSFSMKMPLCLWPKDFLENLIQKGQMTATCQVQKRSGIIFDSDGKLLMCNGLFDYPIGTYKKDFSDSETLVTFLNSEKVFDYYDKINSYPSAKCIGCSMFKICSGGCPLRWAVYNPEETIKGWN